MTIWCVCLCVCVCQCVFVCIAGCFSFEHSQPHMFLMFFFPFPLCEPRTFFLSANLSFSLYLIQTLKVSESIKNHFSSHDHMAPQLHRVSFFLFNNDSESRTPSVALVSGDVFLITADSRARLLVLLLLMNAQHTSHAAYVPCLYSLCVQLQHIKFRGGSFLWQTGFGKGQRGKASHWSLAHIFSFACILSSFSHRRGIAALT